MNDGGDNTETLGARLRIARERKGWTQQQVGTAVGITRAAVARFEGGAAMPMVQTCAELARVLDVRAGWLAFGEGEGPG